MSVVEVKNKFPYIGNVPINFKVLKNFVEILKVKKMALLSESKLSDLLFKCTGRNTKEAFIELLKLHYDANDAEIEDLLTGKIINDKCDIDAIPYFHFGKGFLGHFSFFEMKIIAHYISENEEKKP